MKALVCVAPTEARIEKHPAPDVKPNEVLLRIRQVDLCGPASKSSVAISRSSRTPRMIGHELADEIAAAPSGSSLEIGQVVTVVPTCHALAAISDGEMFDYVFDAAGSAASMNAGLGNVAHLETCVLAGLGLDNLMFPDPAC